MTFEGVYSVLPTPFTDRGDLDEASLRRVVDLFIEKGVNGLTALGVTGEVARLEEPERARRARGGRRRRRRVGCRSSPGRRPRGRGRASATAGRRRRLGAAAVMVSPPRMPKLNSEAVVRHYKALADAVDAADRRAGLSADFGLRDGAGAARPHRARDSVARGRSSSRIRRRRSRRRAFSSRRRAVPVADLRRARRRVPARGADVRRDRRDDRVRVSGDSRADRAAVPRGPGRRGRRPVLSDRAADAVRVPGRASAWRFARTCCIGAARWPARRRGRPRAGSTRRRTRRSTACWPGSTSQKGLEWISV